MRPLVRALPALALLTALGTTPAHANGLLDEQGCRRSIDVAVDLVFRGIGAPEAPHE